ncbi:hypothetical protein N5923_08950 [Erwiniaceae bacterium BAC15a-03b]|uniref:Uncharacterized protein n=1 Tax=Winslowiella arboricola TaxID=2978220 RepID=A0A9J6PJS1_9GAMM|nr:hypothetical protein [Winslowiella arboricola]MCU5771711.1 hypothetical protein [Winslowiella arboricola]MCU5777618.1 hypothetical protein [Winslowiella arboricola]
MSLANILNVALTFFIIAACYYFANKIIKGNQRREKHLMENGISIIITILSMKQTGLFLNNNPVIEMNLKAENIDKNESWLIEKHNETALVIALNDYQVGNVYHAKVGNNKNDIVFIKDESGKPVPILP